MPASSEEVYRLHAEPGALARLTPPWESARVVGEPGNIEELGSRTTLRISVGPFSQDWIAEHRACERGKMFRDVMISGPFGDGNIRTSFSLRETSQVVWKIEWNTNFLWAGLGN